MAVQPPHQASAKTSAFNIGALWRLAAWGVTSAAAVAVVALAATSDDGGRRLVTAWNGAAQQTQRMAVVQPPPPVRTFDAEGETRKLADQLRNLAGDRDSLAERLTSLEHNVEDITGSIKRQAALRQSTGELITGSLPPVWPTVAMTSMPSLAPPASEPAAESVATKTDFGVDLGGATTLDGLRVAWTALKDGQPALFDGLRPVIAVRENAKTKAIELRLVAGPLANAGAAAKLCAGLTAAGKACHAALFDGQRLALR